ncbi:serine protease 27 [Xenopus laevis]|uniref:Serine protease 27 n=1 Tax=Xenopus laevis TaxID=8355 RepID=A0A8J0U2U9_XENLA|nr:serine protease 27 [Xenopus laevis]
MFFTYETFPYEIQRICGFAEAEESLSETCGKPVVVNSRIVGGQDTKKGQNPWQVILWLPGTAHCGGTLISSNFVVTAAQCVVRVNASSVIVILGAYKITGNHKEEVPVLVKRIIIHPKFNESDYPNDVALLELSRKVSFTNVILPACLPTPSTEFLPGHSCIVTGWGALDINSTKPRPVILQEAEMRLITVEHCKIFYSLLPNNIIITESMVCASDINGGKDICHNDIGGPLVCHDGEQWYLVGVVSIGIGCGIGFPGVYTSVPAYMKWIRSFIPAASSGSEGLGSFPGVALEFHGLMSFSLCLCSLFWVTLQNPIFIVMLSAATWVGC